jgi:hypothetical protein
MAEIPVGAQVVKGLGVAAVIGAVVLIGFEIWEHSIRSHTQGCVALATLIDSNITSAKTNPEVYCSIAKSNITLFNTQCPDFSVPQYGVLVPPCA